MVHAAWVGDEADSLADQSFKSTVSQDLDSGLDSRLGSKGGNRDETG
jgi:hypothetical protein